MEGLFIRVIGFFVLICVLIFGGVLLCSSCVSLCLVEVVMVMIFLINWLVMFWKFWVIMILSMCVFFVLVDFIIEVENFCELFVRVLNLLMFIWLVYSLVQCVLMFLVCFCRWFWVGMLEFSVLSILLVVCLVSVVMCFRWFWVLLICLVMLVSEWLQLSLCMELCSRCMMLFRCLYMGLLFWFFCLFVVVFLVLVVVGVVVVGLVVMFGSVCEEILLNNVFRLMLLFMIIDFFNKGVCLLVYCCVKLFVGGFNVLFWEVQLLLLF